MLLLCARFCCHINQDAIAKVTLFFCLKECLEEASVFTIKPVIICCILRCNGIREISSRRLTSLVQVGAPRIVRMALFCIVSFGVNEIRELAAYSTKEQMA